MGGTGLPIFEYKCKSCEKVFEKLVMGTFKKDIYCPNCGSKDVKKLFSSFAAFSNGQSINTDSCSTCSSSSCSTCNR